MRRDLAERVVQITKKLDGALGELAELSSELDEGEARGLRRAIANLVCDIHEKITMKVVDQFPDLHPDRSGRAN